MQSATTATYTIQKRFFAFIKRNPVLLTAALAAAVTALFSPPDLVYLSYFDLKTLSCLFCMLLVVCALRNIAFFSFVAERLIVSLRNARLAVLGVVYITFAGSMLIANDMALITFLPLGYFLLSSAGIKKYMAYTFILQNIAANLGGMLTPFGNPQNLYLYTKFSVPTGEFIYIMLPPFIASFLLITLCCLFVKREPLIVSRQLDALPTGKTVLYLLLFIFTVFIVFRVIPYQLGVPVVTAIVFFTDRKALYSVDYPLLLTFACFFIFAGNMSRIQEVSNFFGVLLEKNTVLSAVFSCQIISNVPSAILLSQFTHNYQELLLGVNIGGLGTLISSLASLITFKEYVKHNPGGAKKYLLLFLLLNILFLGALLLVVLFF